MREHHFYCAGSCFVEHVGRRLQTLLGEGRVCVNPFGALYNPASLAQHFRMLWCGETPLPYRFRADDGIEACWTVGHRFAAERQDNFPARLVEAYANATERLRRADIVLCTWSTDHAFWLTPQGIAAAVDASAAEVQAEECVANCHKMPDRCFCERILSDNDILAPWHALLEAMTAKRFVFTLSPYRYRKHGLHGNALSKARLLLLLDRLCALHPNAAYFPAWEIFVDDLRDYRYYAPDGLHPTDEAADIVFRRFLTWWEEREA